MKEGGGSDGSQSRLSEPSECVDERKMRNEGVLRGSMWLAMAPSLAARKHDEQTHESAPSRNSLNEF